MLSPAATGDDEFDKRLAKVSGKASDEKITPAAIEITAPEEKKESNADFDARLEQISRKRGKAGKSSESNIEALEAQLYSKRKKNKPTTNVSPLAAKPSLSSSETKSNVPKYDPTVGLGGTPSIFGNPQYEQYYVSLLTFIGILILGEGLFLGGSGFLPEEFDNFAVQFVFPAFAPTVGTFLLLSSVYGVLKSQA